MTVNGFCSKQTKKHSQAIINKLQHQQSY